MSDDEVLDVYAAFQSGHLRDDDAERRIECLGGGIARRTETRDLVVAGARDDERHHWKKSLTV